MKFSFAAIAFVCAMPALAHRQVDVKGSIGLASFVDESPDNHLLTGGSARIYLTRRFSIEPEFLYLYRDSKHHDIILMPNLVWDFGGRRVVPYVTGGVGLLRTTDSGFLQSYSHNEGVITAGGGVKIYLNDRWFIVPDARADSDVRFESDAGLGCNEPAVV